MPLEGLADRADRGRQHAAEVRVVLGEAEAAAAGRRRRPDWQALALGERDRLLPGAGGVDVGAGDHHRVGGGIEPVGEDADSGGVGGGATVDAALDRLARVVLVDLGVPVVHRQRDEDRALRRQAGEMGAVGEGERHVLRAGRLVGPLDQGVRHADRVAVGEVGLQGDLRPRLLPGGDEDRRVVGLGVEDRPHRVADAGRRMQVGDGGAAGGLGEAVGHPHHDRLLQAEHVAEVRGEVGEHRQLGRARVAEHRRHPVGAEKVEARFADARHKERNPIAVVRFLRDPPVQPITPTVGPRRQLTSPFVPVCGTKHELSM